MKKYFFVSYIILAVFGFFLIHYTWTSSIAETNNQALKIAKTTASLLDDGMLKELRGMPEDEGTPAYESIKERLITIPQLYDNIQFAYLYTQKNNDLYFMVDSEPGDSEDLSPPGQVFTEASKTDSQPFKDGNSIITKPLTDRWGTWISVLVPIKNLENNDIKVILGMDYPAENFYINTKQRVIYDSLILLFSFLLLFGIHKILINNSALKFEQEKSNFANRKLVESEQQLLTAVTELKEAESGLLSAKEQAESANIAKGQFLANMSHEIRTPMNGILGFMDLLDMSNLSFEQKDYVRELKSSSTLLLSLINGILDFSKIEAGKITLENIQFNLRVAIEDAVSLLLPSAYEKNIELYHLIKAGVPEEVLGDPSRLRQILNNLLSNALKFTEQGEVSLTVDCFEDENQIAVLKFEVKDTGIGISNEIVQNLFQPFIQADASTTRKYGGTGLGLAISKDLSKLMGGDITVKSALGKGSTFQFNVKMKIAKRTSDHKSLFLNLPALNILVVDDNLNNRRIFRAYLQEIGLNVFEAENAHTAIDIIQSNLDTQNKINIALVDYQMPDMNGYELSSVLKNNPLTHDINLILATSSAQKGDSLVAQNHGFLGYLSKPVRRNEVLGCVAIVLGLKDTTGAENQIVTRFTVKEVNNALKPSILVVDDNAVNRKLITIKLESNGLSCDLAVNGEEALLAVRNKIYDIVFMDCQMPVMDGYESTKRIRDYEGQLRHTSIIAITANAMEGDREECISAGMDDYLSKPIDYNRMFQLIEYHAKNNKNPYR